MQEKCKLCDEEFRSVVFIPCEHKVVCVECSVRMKRCLECNQPIKEKITCGGEPVGNGGLLGERSGLARSSCSRRHRFVRFVWSEKKVFLLVLNSFGLN